MTLAFLPVFSTWDHEHFVEKLEAMLNQNLSNIERLLSENTQYTWDNLMLPLEEQDDALEKLWAPFSHLHGVVNTPELRKAYQQCLPKLSAYESSIGQNQKLYEAVLSLDTTHLNAIQKKILNDLLLGFKLSGVNLLPQDKQTFERIQTRLSELNNQYENNVLDAGQAYQHHVLDFNRLTGLPEHALYHARELCEQKGLEGWMFNLEIPCYLAIVTYAEDRALREEIYKAYVTRASEIGPSANRFDNGPIMNEILALRQEKAKLLGFAHYAELSLATKMATSVDEVMGFLNDLNDKAHAQARLEMDNLRQFAKDHYSMDEVMPWDIAFLSEKKKQLQFAISEEELRPYFPLPQVLSGIFEIIEKLYGMRVEIITGVDVWHPEVTCYQISDEEGHLRGFIYADLFARQNKRGGAWMDAIHSRRKCADGSIQIPVATLTCNFAKPTANKPATLSHDELTTFFHEFGHCLHHVLTQVNYLSASGIHGVEWDAVELPSQFFENWCWREEGLDLLTAHIDHGGTLPLQQLNQLLAAKNFQSAMAMVRQLEFSLFDLCIHQEYEANDPYFIANRLAQIRQKTAVVPIAQFNRFQNSFTHIFSGGYGAGYYSYKWAEVLSSDAFSRFEEEGVLNPKTGRDFLHAILEVGGSKKALEAYLEFRGKPATIDALLKHNGIIINEEAG